MPVVACCLGGSSETPPVGGLAALGILPAAALLKNDSFRGLGAVADKIQCAASAVVVAKVSKILYSKILLSALNFSP